MREHKFRAYDKKEKRWLHNYETLGGCSIFGETILLGAWMSEVRLEDLNYVEVTQFTGLRDKHGKEIYEGDILKCGENIVVVSWHDNFGSFCVSKSGWMYSHFFGEGINAKECEILGNIYENPELLDGGR